MALPLSLQYPKTIITKYIKWVMKTEENAIEYIDFVQTRGRSVANALFAMKMKSMVESPEEPLVFSFSINKQLPMLLTVDPVLFPVLDLWEELESLHTQLTDIVVAAIK